MSKSFWEGLFSVPRVCTQSPFWFLNDRVDAEEYVSQVESMAEKGVMQVMPHPRYGMDRREYLGGKYMDAFEKMVIRADELGMGVNLYDDFNWSSGQCGGRITADRHMCALGLAMNRAEVTEAGTTVCFERWTDGFRGWAQFEEVLVAGWAPALSETTLNFDRMTMTDQWTMKRGRFEMVVPEGGVTAFVIYTVRTIHESPLREGNGGIVDYLNAEPTRRFIESTHEKYYDRLGQYFGNTIQSVFSDEVGPYSCGDFTWTEDFREYFRLKKGYDIEICLPMLYFDGSSMARKVRCDYWDVVTMAYQERFMKPIADWCRAHQVASTGHGFEESRLWMISGSMYESLRTQMWVGVDSLLGYKPYSMIKPAISVAHTTGRREVLCEAVGVIGEDIGEHGSWTCSPRQVKYAYNQLGIAGVNVMVPHAFFQSVDNPKVECPPSFFRDNHYWRYYKDIERLTEMMCYVNRVAAPVIDVAVYYPVVSWWSLSRGGRGRGMPAGIPRAREVDSYRESERFDSIVDGLMRRQLDHDVLDLKALLEAQAGADGLRLSDAHYRALVLPPMSCARRAELERLNELARAGVRMISLGEFHPVASVERGEGDAQMETLVRALSPYITVANDLDEMERLLRESFAADITIEKGCREDLDAAHRRVENIDIYLLSNLRDCAVEMTLRLRAAGKHALMTDSLLHPLELNISFEEGMARAEVVLPAEELCYLILSDDEIPELEPSGTQAQSSVKGRISDLAGWRMTPTPGFDGGFPYGVLPMQELAVPVGRTIEVRDGAGERGFRDCWMEREFDDSAWEIVKLKRGPALYSHKNSQFFRFTIPAGACALKVPFPSDCEYALYIDGDLILKKMDFQGTESLWLPVCGCEREPGILAVETASMRPGFGLTSAPVFLIHPFERGLSEWKDWGIDWYSGFAVYEKRFFVDGVVSGACWLDLGEVRECCEVWVNGERVGHRVWPPYRFEVSRFLRPGENRLRVAVCNLMSNEYAWDTLGSRGTGRYLESGLLGMVTLNDIPLD